MTLPIGRKRGGSSGLPRYDAMVSRDGFSSSDQWDAQSFCFMVGPNLAPSDWHLFAAPVVGDNRGYIREPYKVLPDNATMLDVLVEARVFKSKTEARKNWKGSLEIPWGWAEHQLSKRPTLIITWKPSASYQTDFEPIEYQEAE